jgi:hypothetical protein
VPNCLGSEMSHTGAEVSSIRSLSPENSNWNVVSMKNSVTGMSVNYKTSNSIDSDVLISVF